MYPNMIPVILITTIIIQRSVKMGIIPKLAPQTAAEMKSKNMWLNLSVLSTSGAIRLPMRRPADLPAKVGLCKLQIVIL